MKNECAFDDSTGSSETPEDVFLDEEPNMEYVFTTSDGYVCDLTLQASNGGLNVDVFQQDLFHSVLQVGPYNVRRSAPSTDIISFEGDV